MLCMCSIRITLGESIKVRMDKEAPREDHLSLSGNKDRTESELMQQGEEESDCIWSEGRKDNKARYQIDTMI